MGIKDIVDKAGVNIDYTKVMGQLAGAISSSFDVNGKERMRIDSNGNTTFPNWQDILMDSMDKRMITIRNPEKLNTGPNGWTDGWSIEYMGRDLSLSEDNYRWDVYNDTNGVRGYWILEREIQHDSWLWIRWGKTKVDVKERKEHIDKKHLRDKSMIQRNMLVSINSLG